MTRYAVAILLTIAIVSAGTAPVRSADAGSLLSMHGQYVGWQFGGYQTMRIQGETTNASGETEGHWLTREIGAAYRTVASGDVPDMPEDSGFTGRVFWSSDENGFTRPNYSTYQNYAISVYTLFNEGTSQLTGTAEPSETVNGTSYPVVRVTPPSGDAIDLAIDPSTGAYVRATIDPGGAYETTYDILGYKEFAPGKRFIGSYRVEGGDVTNTVASVTTNGSIAPEELHPPSPTATWTFGAPTPVPITITPFAILVTATINGTSGLFVLDSGASNILLTGDFAARAHVNVEGGTTVSGLESTARAGLGHVNLSIAGSTLNNVLVAVSGRDITVNATNYQSQQGTLTINGFIGYPLLGAAIVTLSTSDKTLTVQDPSQVNVDRSAGYNALVDLNSGTPFVPITIDGRASVISLLDTGNGSFVVMSNETVAKHHIPIMSSEGTESTVGQMYQGANSNFDPEAGTQVEDYMRTHRVVEDVNGHQETQRCSVVSSMQLGSINYQGTFACVSPHMTGDEVIMGYDFLRNFDLVFDYPEGMIIMTPHHQ